MLLPCNIVFHWQCCFPCNVVFLAMLFSLQCCFPCNIVFLAFCFPFVMLLSLQCCFPCNVVFVAFCFPFVMLLFLQCCFPFALYKIDHTWCALDQADTKSRFKFSDNKLGRGVLGLGRSKSGSQQRFVFQIWNLASNPLDNFPLYGRCILDLEPSIQTFGQLYFVFWIWNLNKTPMSTLKVELSFL